MQRRQRCLSRELKDLDPDECIDPYCRVHVCDAVGSPNRQWELLGQTEVIGNTDAPEWSTKICLTYFFEEQAILGQFFVIHAFHGFAATTSL